MSSADGGVLNRRDRCDILVLRCFWPHLHALQDWSIGCVF